MSFIVGVKLLAASADAAPALDIRTTLAATEMHERESNSRIGLCMMFPSSCMESTIHLGSQENFSRAATPRFTIESFVTAATIHAPS
jgi:hypothetical protein